MAGEQVENHGYGHGYANTYTYTYATLPHIALAILTYWIAATAYSLLTAPTIPISIPWMGYGKGWIAGLRNYLAVSQSKGWMLAGYEKYSRRGDAFVLPPTLGMYPEVVVPRSIMQWMFDQPDNVLSVSAAHYDILQGSYAFVKPIILKDPYHEHVVHRNLLRNLNFILPEIAQEVPHAVTNIYGTDTEHWKTINVMDSFMKMIPGITNRMLVGKALCHQSKYLDAVTGFTSDVVRTQALMLIVPRALHPIVGTLLSLPSKYHYWLSSRFTLPMIKQRISDITKKDAGHPDYKDWTEPKDFFTWTYRTAQAEGRHDEMQPERMAKRILPLNFASIHTTSLTGYEAIVEILNAGPDVVRQLREEVYRITQEEGGCTRAGLTRMYRLDSAIRESQRLSPIALTFNHRKVVAKEGIVLPDGTHIKQGTIISCPWMSIASDTEVYDKPGEYDPFRYSRAREAYEAMTPEEKAKVDLLKLKQSGIVTTSIQHLAFGHGRHAW